MRSVSVPRLLSALCALFLFLALLPAVASATSSQAEIDAAVDGAVAYVLPQQEASTGAIPGFGGDWVLTSLAAAGVDAAVVHGPGPGDPTLQDFTLSEYASEFWNEDPPLSAATDYERAILVASAAGLDPARLAAGANLPAQLAGRWNLGAGSFGEPSPYSTAFGIYAMRTTPLPRWALDPAVAFLRQHQHDDGGWTFGPSPTPADRAEPSEEDITGATVGALCAAGVPAYDPDVAAALGFLRGRLVNATGGIEYLWGAPNADTNAWIVSGLNACGIDPQSAAWTTAAGKTPVDFLLSLQVPSGPEAGGFGYENSSSANLYSTQDALRAIAGSGFTVTPPSFRTPPTVAAGTPVPHVLAVELAPGNVRVCKVTAPVGAPLATVLATAKAGSHPAGCINSLATADGVVTAIDGFSPEGADEAWLARLDRGAEAAAGQQPVGFGDLIALRIGSAPGSGQGPAGPAGSPGAAGPKGAKGKRGERGPKGRPGRNATIACVAKRSRSGKRVVRCTVRQAQGKKHRAG